MNPIRLALAFALRYTMKSAKGAAAPLPRSATGYLWLPKKNQSYGSEFVWKEPQCVSNEKKSNLKVS